MSELKRQTELAAVAINAALAAARREGAETEREKVAAFMLARGVATGHGDTTEDLLLELGDAWDLRPQEGAEEMRERAASEARYWTASQKVADRILALPLTPEDPPVALCCQGDVPLSECSLYPDHCTPEEPI